MTKLEEKLIELRYDVEVERSWDCLAIPFIRYYGNHKLVIYFNKVKETCKNYCVIPINYYSKQSDIDNLQQAFNMLQKDLEVLKGEE